MEIKVVDQMHKRLFLVLDELHRIGFEQLRFSRSREGQRIRMQLYAARTATMQDYFYEGTGPMFCLSDNAVWTNYASNAAVAWPRLLESDTKPKHLASLFILDFPEIMRLAHAPDHEYREWFRTLRPALLESYLPVTWSEDPYGTKPNFGRYTVLCKSEDQRLLPRPPDNPFVQTSNEDKRS